MKAGLFAKKIGMTQIFDESGKILPVTVLKTGLCKVSQIKTTSTDGYDAVQLAYGEQKLTKLPKPIQGHLKMLEMKGLDPLENSVWIRLKIIA